MKSQNKKLIIGLSIVILIALIGYFIFNSKPSTQMVSIGEMYDANKNLIKPMSVVEGTEGVKYIKFNITIKNLDTIPLTFNVKSVEPTEISYAKPTNKLIINPNEQGIFQTNLVDIESYEGLVQDFCFTVEAEKINALRESKEIKGCISLKIDPNPIANFDINIDSSIGTGEINPSCTENWGCSLWSQCNGIQTRTCTDLNNCGTILNKPIEQQSCGESFTTNAISGNYKTSGVWINFGNGVYNYGGYSSYRCLIANKIAQTTEGFLICSRPGYDISSRVYLDDGSYGIIFKL